MKNCLFVCSFLFGIWSTSKAQLVLCENANAQVVRDSIEGDRKYYILTKNNNFKKQDLNELTNSSKMHISCNDTIISFIIESETFSFWYSLKYFHQTSSPEYPKNWLSYQKRQKITSIGDTVSDFEAIKLFTNDMHWKKINFRNLKIDYKSLRPGIYTPDMATLPPVEFATEITLIDAETVKVIVNRYVPDPVTQLSDTVIFEKIYKLDVLNYGSSVVSERMLETK